MEAPGASTGSANTANSPNGSPISDIDSGFQKKQAAATSRPPITPTEPSTGIALNSSSPLWRAHSLTSESNDLRATCICLPTSTASRSRVEPLAGPDPELVGGRGGHLVDRPAVAVRPDERPAGRGALDRRHAPVAHLQQRGGVHLVVDALGEQVGALGRAHARRAART